MVNKMKLEEAKKIATTDKERKRDNLDEAVTRTIARLIDTAEHIQNVSWDIEHKAAYIERELNDSMRLIKDCINDLDKAEEIARIFENIEG